MVAPAFVSMGDKNINVKPVVELASANTEGGKNNAKSVVDHRSVSTVGAGWCQTTSTATMLIVGKNFSIRPI